MNNDAKIIAIVLGGTILVIFGLALLNGRSSALTPPSKSQATQTQVVSGLGADPQPYSTGDVPYKGGVLKLSFALTNSSSQPLKLQRITTSCMCTQAAVKVGDQQTSFFGMDMYGVPNPAIDFTIPAGSQATLLVTFDPTAHGPAGIGPFSRTIHLEFSSPAGYKDVNFNGTVVNG